MNNDIKLYAVLVEVEYEAPTAVMVFLDTAAAKAKFDELVEKEASKPACYDYISLREFPLNGDMVNDGRDVMVWNPNKKTLKVIEAA